MKTVTLKHIANQLNISVTTVSKALKDYPDVNEITKQRVKQLAEELNYVPNATAVTLRTKETKTVGVIIPVAVHHFFSSIIQGILHIADAHNYLVILLLSNESYELEKKQVDLLLNKRVDGIMISLSNNTRRFDHLKKIMENNTPLVLFDKITKVIDCSKVVIDDKKAAYDAVSFLIKKGYRKIAHFRGHLNPQNSIDRFLGYKQALIDNGIPYDSNLVYICDNNSDFEDGQRYAKLLLEEHPDVDAIFTITDVIATGAINYFKNHNVRVPDDIAVFGFSNWFMSSVIAPPLSTVEQPGYDIGKEAMTVLLSEMNNKKVHKTSTPQHIVLPTKLIIRESC